MTYSPYLSPSNLKSRIKKTDIIIAPDGRVVYPQSLYLVSKLRGEAAVKDTGSIAKGLLAFTRYLEVMLSIWSVVTLEEKTAVSTGI